MHKIDKQVEHNGRILSIFRTSYANGQTALMLTDPTTGIPYAKATVVLEGYEPPEGYVFIKNWSENEGILESLVKAGIVEFTGKTAPTGFVEAHLCKLLV